MAKGIYIRKIREKENIHYYFVSDFNPDPKPCEFYIGIDSQQKLVLFFKTDNFDDNPLGIIDFSQSDEISKVEGLRRSASYLAAIQAYRALKSNFFSDDIGWYS